VAAHSGQFYSLDIGRQTAKGTAQTTPKFKMRLTGGAVAPELGVLDLLETDASIQRGPSVKVGQLVGGAIEGYLRSDECAMLAYGALGANVTTGASPYTHTATGASAPPYFTLYSTYDTTALVDRYVDCRIPELTIRGGGGQALTYSAGFQGLTATHGETMPGLAVSIVEPLVYPHVTVTLGGATTDIVESFEVTSSKNVTVVQGDTGVFPSDVVLGRWSVAGTMTILFETDAKWRLWTTGSTSGTTASANISTEALTITATRSASDEVSMVMTAVELRQISITPDPSGEPVRMTYAFSARPQTVIANTFSIISKNLVAAL
jgi:tail tube protein